MGDHARGAAGFPDRLFDARLALNHRERRTVENPEFGALVAKAMKRERPFAPSSVSQWGTATQGASIFVIEAIAKVCGVRAGWLAFGEGPMRTRDVPSARTADDTQHTTATPGAAAGRSVDRAG